MSATGTRAATLDLVGGRLCLDFANTVGAHDTDHPREHLTSYADLVAWSQHAGVLTTAQAQPLLRAGEDRPTAAAAVLARAIALREAIYRVFSAVAAGRAVEDADLGTLNGALAEALARSRIVATADGFAWGWTPSPDALDQMLWPVARSAAELLTEGELARVRECGGDGCGWLFLDLSRNHSRRWCDMQDCGNRAKARRHYQRRRAGTAAASGS